MIFQIRFLYESFTKRFLKRNILLEISEFSFQKVCRKKKKNFQKAFPERIILRDESFGFPIFRKTKRVFKYSFETEIYGCAKKHKMHTSLYIIDTYT